MFLWYTVTFRGVDPSNVLVVHCHLKRQFRVDAGVFDVFCAI